VRQLVPPEEVLVGGVVKIEQLPVRRLRVAGDVEIDGIAPDRQEMLVVAFLERRREPPHHPLAHHLLGVVDAGNPDRPQGPAEQCTPCFFHGNHLAKGKLKSVQPSTSARRTSGMYSDVLACLPRNAG
jgi:hypothetical protein